jgi:hypothetical protein
VFKGGHVAFTSKYEMYNEMVREKEEKREEERRKREQQLMEE